MKAVLKNKYNIILMVVLLGIAVTGVLTFCIGFSSDADTNNIKMFANVLEGNYETGSTGSTGFTGSTGSTGDYEDPTTDVKEPDDTTTTTTVPATDDTTAPVTDDTTAAPTTEVPFIAPTTAAATTTTAAATTEATTAATTKARPKGAKRVNGNWVNPSYKKTAVSKIKKGKKSLKITLKKVKGVKGYQIQYSTSKKFTKKKSKAVAINSNKAKKPAKTIKKLKSNKKYYVRVRTYKMVKVNGKNVKVFSKWSKVKAVKTK